MTEAGEASAPAAGAVAIDCEGTSFTLNPASCNERTAARNVSPATFGTGRGALDGSSGT
jgi:hypothetical protein